MISIVDTLRQWTEDEATKAAAEAESSHASSGADGHTQPAQTGERAAENESDVKSQIIGQSVDEASAADVEGAGRGVNAPTHSTGVKSTATGDDPAVETASANAHTSDPGTTHPARADGGEKYSALQELGDRILANIAVCEAVGASPGEKGAAATEGTPAVAAVAPVQAEPKADTGVAPVAAEADAGEKVAAGAGTEEQQAEEAGRQAAQLVAKAAGLDQLALSPEQALSDLVKVAEHDALLVSDYLDGWQKTAGTPGIDEGGVQLAESSDAGGDDAAAAIDEAVAAAGVDGAGAGDPALAAAPEDEALAAEAVGGDAAVGGGGDAVGAEALTDLAEALVDQGIAPETILAQLGGGADAGAGVAGAADEIPPEVLAEGLPPEVAPEAAPVEPKLASRQEKVAAVAQMLLKAARSNRDKQSKS